MANPKNSAWYDSTEVGPYGANVASKVVTFAGGAGTGAVGLIELFTVTGAVAFNMSAICSVILATQAGATISVGTDGAVDDLIAVPTGVDIDAGDIWFAAAPATVLDTLANTFLEFAIGDGSNIRADVAVDAIDTGEIEFRVFWTPLTVGASVVAV